MAIGVLQCDAAAIGRNPGREEQQRPMFLVQCSFGCGRRRVGRSGAICGVREHDTPVAEVPHDFRGKAVQAAQGFAVAQHIGLCACRQRCALQQDECRSTEPCRLELGLSSKLPPGRSHYNQLVAPAPRR